LAELSTDELRQALEFVRQVQSAPDLDAYRTRILGIRVLVPCDAVSYNEVDAKTGEFFHVIDPPEAAFPGIVEAFSRNAHQHPVIRHVTETGDQSVHAISDFLSADELHELDLYREVYARVGAEDQLSFPLPPPPGMVVGIALNRSSRGFSPQERELVELVRPHLSQAFRDARERALADPLAPERLQALGLTGREAEIAGLLVEGRSAAQLASELTISVHTARNHIASIYTKLGVRTRAGAVATILRGGPGDP
jgi:DNA-binding CsgD family transcriptional regulator